MTLRPGTAVKLAGREAIAQAMDLLLQHYRSGDVAAFSMESSPNGTARISAVYAPGVPPLELPGVAVEDDELLR